MHRILLGMASATILSIAAMGQSWAGTDGPLPPPTVIIEENFVETDEDHPYFGEFGRYDVTVSGDGWSLLAFGVEKATAHEVGDDSYAAMYGAGWFAALAGASAWNDGLLIAPDLDTADINNMYGIDYDDLFDLDQIAFYSVGLYGFPFGPNDNDDRWWFATEFLASNWAAIVSNGQELRLLTGDTHTEVPEPATLGLFGLGLAGLGVAARRRRKR